MPSPPSPQKTPTQPTHAEHPSALSFPSLSHSSPSHTLPSLSLLPPRPPSSLPSGLHSSWNISHKLSAFAIAAESGGDISAGVAFAAKHNLRIAVKNTGHDWFGRSGSHPDLGVSSRLTPSDLPHAPGPHSPSPQPPQPPCPLSRRGVPTMPHDKGGSLRCSTLGWVRRHAMARHRGHEWLRVCVCWMWGHAV